MPTIGAPIKAKKEDSQHIRRRKCSGLVPHWKISRCIYIELHCEPLFCDKNASFIGSPIALTQ